MSIFRIVGELNHFSPSLVIANSLGYNFFVYSENGPYH